MAFIRFSFGRLRNSDPNSPQCKSQLPELGVAESSPLTHAMKTEAMMTLRGKFIAQSWSVLHWKCCAHDLSVAFILSHWLIERGILSTRVPNRFRALESSVHIWFVSNSVRCVTHIQGFDVRFYFSQMIGHCQGKSFLSALLFAQLILGFASTYSFWDSLIRHIVGQMMHHDLIFRSRVAISQKTREMCHLTCRQMFLPLSASILVSMPGMKLCNQQRKAFNEWPSSDDQEKTPEEWMVSENCTLVRSILTDSSGQ